MTTSSTQRLLKGRSRTRGFGVDNTSHDHDQLCWARDWLAAEHDTVQVPVASLVQGDSPRLTGESKADAQLMAAAVDVPPVIVHQATMTVIDGWRRVLAAQHRHQDVIAARFFHGTLQAGFVLAVAANAAHGLSLCTQDRKAAAARLLGMHPDCSDRMIAAIANLSHHTVGDIRRHLSSGQIAQFKKRLGRDGKTRPATSRRRPGTTPPAVRDASSRGADEQTDGSSCTVHDVRDRLRQSGNPSVSRTRAAGLDYSVARGHTALERLRHDPSVRDHDDGKVLLRLLSNSLKFVSATRALTRRTPEHCLNAVAEFAAALSDAWNRVAQELLARVRAG
jgi:hypothetical protein